MILPGILPVSFPFTVGQEPLHYDMYPTGRPKPENGPSEYTSRYLDCSNGALYPFGYGLSYTNFEISKISLTNEKEEIQIKVKVKNRGKYKGKEVVQVYVSPSQVNADKPYQSLVAFAKTKTLKESQEIEMDLSFKLSSVARYDEKEANYILDKGNYTIRVGNSSNNTKVYGYVELKEDIVTEELKYMDLRNYVLKDDNSADLKFFIVPTIEQFIEKEHPAIFSLVITSQNSMADFEDEVHKNIAVSTNLISKKGQYKDFIINKEYEYLNIAPH